MPFKFSCNNQRVILFALIFLAMQVYALYMSTTHVLHGMPPMCQLCATVEKYDNSVVSETVFVLRRYSHFLNHILLLLNTSVSEKSVYLRARLLQFHKMRT